MWIEERRTREWDERFRGDVWVRRGDRGTRRGGEARRGDVARRRGGGEKG